MNDSVFRTRKEPLEPVPEAVAKDSPGTSITNVEPPFTSWEGEKGKPYLVEYFGLGDLWKDRVGGFEDEIKTINLYLENEISNGKIDDSVGSIKELMKRMEKESNIEKTDRTVVKIAKLAAYTEFLYKTRDIEKNNWKYSR